MGAKSKRASKVRTESEFALSRLTSLLEPPPAATSVYSWSLAEIFAARDAQMRGQFALAARLAASMRTDDALAVARWNRLAPQRCIKVEVVPAKGARGAKPASEAEALYGQEGVAISPGTLSDIDGCLTDHGLAVATNQFTVREDGSRVDVEIKYWPIEHVRWDAYAKCYKARVGNTSDARVFSPMGEEVITHGDGRWIIFSMHDHEPFAQEAAIVPGSLVWARHAFAIRDWAKGSVSHGSAKIVGELPQGVPLQDANGLTKEAAALATLLRSLASDDSPIGILPFGAKADFLANKSTAWQIFEQLALNGEKAAARIYLGTDGTLGSQGGAPGVDVEALFGVARTKVEAGLTAIERGIRTGSIEIWCALNFGDSTLAPTRRYMIPDADADADRASYATRKTAFYEEIKAARENGFAITQGFVDAIAKKHDVEPPELAALPGAAPAPAAPGTTPQVTPPASALRRIRGT